MSSSRSPRQQLEALCHAWERYVALPHARANMASLANICKEIMEVPIDKLMANERSPNDNPWYYLLLGQMVLEADALPLAASVLHNTDQRVKAEGCNATAASSTATLAE